jgi:calreticulin
MLKGLKLLSLMAGAANAEVYFKDTIESMDSWTSSGDGKFVHAAGPHYGDATADKGLKTSQDARFYHISTTFDEFSNKDKNLVLSFSVQHGQKIDCGGGYLKFTPAGLDQSTFNGDSEYNIMFGPDICGSSTKKVHVILNYKGKNVLINKNIPAETDQLTHFYTLILNKDQTYEVQIDGQKKESGSLTEDFDFLLPKEIKDPNESKPADWVDEAMMDDPEDKKPEGYDDIPKMIPDPDAEKPDDWDDEDDGEWEAPELENPEYKGEWKPKRIEHPEYQGPWVHPMIPNPDYEDDDSIYAFDSFGAVGVDIWQVKSGTVFDNIIVADNIEEVQAFIKENDNREAEKAMFTVAEDEKRAKEEAERAAAEEARKAEEEEEDDDDDDDDEDDVDDAINQAKEEL